MAIAETRTPFGVVRLELTGARIEGDFVWAPVAAPGVTAMQVTAYANAAPGAEIEIRLTSEIETGFRMGLLVQDGIEAHAVTGDALTAAFGLRNGLWIDAQPGLSMTAFEGGAGRAHYAIRSHEHSATAFSAVVAWADTHNTDMKPMNARETAPRDAVVRLLAA